MSTLALKRPVYSNFRWERTCEVPKSDLPSRSAGLLYWARMLLITLGSWELGKGDIVSFPTTLGKGRVGSGGWSYSMCFLDSILGSLAKSENSPEGPANCLGSSRAIELDFFMPRSGIVELSVSSASTRARLFESPRLSMGATNCEVKATYLVGNDVAAVRKLGVETVLQLFLRQHRAVQLG